MEKDFKYFEIINLGGERHLLCQPTNGIALKSDDEIINYLKILYGRSEFEFIGIIRKNFSREYFLFCEQLDAIPSYEMSKLRYTKSINMTALAVFGTLLIIGAYFLIGSIMSPVLLKWVVLFGFLFGVMMVYKLYMLYRLTCLIYTYEQRDKIASQ